MSTLDNAVKTINESAERTDKTTKFVDDWSTLDDTSLVTNPNNNVTIPSAQKKIKDLVTELGIDTDAAQSAAQSASDSKQEAAISATEAEISATTAANASINSAKNKNIVDAQGNINQMVMIPAFNCEDINAAILERFGVDMQLGTGLHPAFLTAGVPRKYIWIGKYQASAGVGGTCSVVPNVQPSVNVNFDTAKSRCENKGAGWHLMSMHEWAAAALWSLASGTIPRGNTNWGRSHEKPYETAVRADLLAPGDAGGTGRSNTGTGPATWAHDHSDFGIHDLVGNTWEWLDQFKIFDGQIITTADNDPSKPESDWLVQNAYFDAVNGVELSDSVTVTAPPNKPIADVGQSATYTPNLLLRQMLVEFSAKPLNVGRLYVNNEGERTPRRGGIPSTGSDAGLGALSLSYDRSTTFSNFGFRPAFFE